MSILWVSSCARRQKAHQERPNTRSLPRGAHLHPQLNQADVHGVYSAVAQMPSRDKGDRVFISVTTVVKHLRRTQELTCAAQLGRHRDVSAPQTDLPNPQRHQEVNLQVDHDEDDSPRVSSPFFSSHTCSSLVSSGTTRNVFQPWRFFDLRMSPKMWSPTYRMSFPLISSRSQMMSEDPTQTQELRMGCFYSIKITKL